LQKTTSSIKDKLPCSIDAPLVSVLVPTYNSERTIEKCIKSIKAQTYQNIEVIVIDNFSSDRTREIAETLGVKTLTKGPERSAQMNYGASCAKGKYILRVDSDMILDRDLVEKCREPCYNGIEAVIVPVLPHPSGSNNFWVSCRILETRMLLDDMVNVAPRFMDRSVFLAVGGYDEAIVAWEDYDLHNRLLASKCRVFLLQDSALWHLGEASSLSDVVVRMISYGKTGSLSLFTKKHGLKGLKQISIIRPSFFRHRNYFFRDPLHFTGLLFMKLVQTSSVGIGALAKHSDSS
jgi:glycosyltransferase involved in cell wall biosynthesis